MIVVGAVYGVGLDVGGVVKMAVLIEELTVMCGARSQLPSEINPISHRFSNRLNLINSQGIHISQNQRCAWKSSVKLIPGGEGAANGAGADCN